MFVNNSGVTVEAGTLNAETDLENSYEALKIENTYTSSLGENYNLFHLETMSPSYSHYTMKAQSQSNNRFTVKGGGLIEIWQEGLQITGGMSIMSHGMRVAGGITVENAYFHEAGFKTSQGFTIHDHGMMVFRDGVGVTGGATLNSAGMKLRSNGVSVESGGFYLSGSTQPSEIRTRGITTTGGLTSYSEGLRIVSGGMTVSSDGLRVTGTSLTVKSGLFTKDIHTAELQVDAGLTKCNRLVDNNDLGSGTIMTVEDVGMVIKNGVLDLTNFVVTGGMTAENLYTPTSTIQGNTHVTGNFNHIAYYPAVSRIPKYLGATVTGGLTVNSEGANVAGGVTIHDGGMTVFGASHFENTHTVFSDRRLKANIDHIDDALAKVSKLNGVILIGGKMICNILKVEILTMIDTLD